MRYSKDLIGKSIVSIDDGRDLGTVRDVYLDQNLEWLAGIYLGKEGLLSRKALVIPREEIAVFGVDYVLTKSGDVVTDEKQLSDVASWLRLDQLQGREVDSTGGTRVGTVGDAILDEQARIVGFSLSRVYVEGPIAENRTVYQAAIVDKGNSDGVMTVDLATVEQQSQAGAGAVVEAPAKVQAEPEPPAEPEPLPAEPEPSPAEPEPPPSAFHEEE
ncbi:MAG TPA: PRC-barrel domain-containing protein [Candidatus Sulfomarinibacteraceae bacterium]|nr:PRC-barrel domain-containing protein [Candidatus Sulfomarinibacteraceae bacterium]